METDLSLAVLHTDVYADLLKEHVQVDLTPDETDDLMVCTYQQIRQHTSRDTTTNQRRRYERYMRREKHITPLHFQLNFEEECRVRRHNKRKIPYFRCTHFKEHLRRIQAREIFTFPAHILALFQHYPHDWQDENMYIQCRTFMKQHRLHRKYYEHIFLLAAHFSGKRIRIPDRMEYLWINLFKLCEIDVLHHYPAKHLNKNNFPSYIVLIQVLFEKFRIATPYNLPDLKGRKKYDIFEYFYYLVNRVCAHQKFSKNYLYKDL